MKIEVKEVHVVAALAQRRQGSGFLGLFGEAIGVLDTAEPEHDGMEVWGRLRLASVAKRKVISRIGIGATNIVVSPNQRVVAYNTGTSLYIRYRGSSRHLTLRHVSEEPRGPLVDETGLLPMMGGGPNFGVHAIVCSDQIVVAAVAGPGSEEHNLPKQRVQAYNLDSLEPIGQPIADPSGLAMIPSGCIVVGGPEIRILNPKFEITQAFGKSTDLDKPNSYKVLAVGGPNSDILVDAAPFMSGWRDIRLYSVSGTLLRRWTFRTLELEAHCGAISADGSRVAFATSTGDAFTMSCQSVQDVRHLHIGQVSRYSVMPRHDGLRQTCPGPSSVNVWDIGFASDGALLIATERAEAVTDLAPIYTKAELLRWEQ